VTATKASANGTSSNTALPIEVPALTRPPRVKKLTTAERVTESGLRIVVVRRPGIPMVEVRLRVPFLSARAAHAAKALVLAETMLTGVADLDRAGVAEQVQELGASLDVSVDADRLMIGGSVLAPNLRRFLALIADTLTAAKFPADEVDAERDRLVERLTIARSRAGTVAAEALAHRMFGDHPYARDLPQVPDVQGVTAAQVRRLHADFVRPKQATIVLVGDISPARTMDAVEQALSAWQGAAPAPRVAKLAPIVAGPVLLVDRPGSVQSSIRLGGTALRRDDPRYPALQLANLVFGGYFSSRWNENIREEKGYTYGSHSRLEHNVLGSTITCEADVATEVTAPALLETWYELGRISALPVTEAEVASARQYAIGTLALSTATQAGLASTLSGLSGLYGMGLDGGWLQRHSQLLATVGLDEIAQAAEEFLAPTRLVTVVVGDAASIAEPLARLGSVDRSQS
jgi:predicted Zn-dependent peptidase